MQFLFFIVENRTFALDLTFVERVVWAVSMIPIPKIQEKKHCGMINVYGQIMPVISMRELFKMTEREMELSDQFIVCRISEGYSALWVDKVLDVREFSSEDLISAENIFPNHLGVKQVIKEKENIVFVWNLHYEEAKN